MSSTPIAPSQAAPTGVWGRIVAHVRQYPSGIPYIVGNEACERFSFYGMRAILWVYLSTLFLGFAPADSVSPEAKAAAESLATSRVHLFFAGVYAFPMLGAIISDRLLGKYRTIMWVSLIYCAGHAVLALAGRTETGVMVGLSLIALGSGGIKPCVSANVGDQFNAGQKHLVEYIFQVFYFSVNFGSFFSTLLTPWLYKHVGPEVAFGVPGVLMFIATIFFWAGRNKFVKVPPSPGGKIAIYDTVASSALFTAFAIWAFAPQTSWVIKLVVSVVSLVLFLVVFTVRQRIQQDNGFIAVTLYALTHQRERATGQRFFDVARARFGDEAAEGPPAVLRIMLVFSMVSVFWALFDQHSTSWINQATRMDLGSLEPSQLPALNPLMVMGLIPILNLVVYPALRGMGVKLTAVRKMTAGMFLASLSFVVVALLQRRIDALALSGEKVDALWQILPYLVLTVSEVLISAVGLEFAYTQAPRTMKSTIMGLWYLTITAGNLLVALLAGFQGLELQSFFWVFAGLMGLAALIFAVLTSFYKGRTYLADGTVQES